MSSAHLVLLISLDELAATAVALLCTGRGSYGSVYQARVKDTDEVVAVKVIPVGEHDEISEIQKEIDMLKECNHPNVVQYLVSNRLLACLPLPLYTALRIIESNRL